MSISEVNGVQSIEEEQKALGVLVAKRERIQREFDSVKAKWDRDSARLTRLSKKLDELLGWQRGRLDEALLVANDVPLGERHHHWADREASWNAAERAQLEFDIESMRLTTQIEIEFLSRFDPDAAAKAKARLETAIESRRGLAAPKAE